MLSYLQKACPLIISNPESEPADKNSVQSHSHSLINFSQAPPSPFLRELHGIEPNISFLSCPDGIDLRVACFRPRRTPTSTLLIIPGQNDPIEYQRRLATLTARLGALTFVYDPRSQGYSGRTAGLQRIDSVNRFDHIYDLKLVVDEIVKPAQIGKLTIAGFSMGALHMLIGLARQDFAADMAVAVAPALKILDIPSGNFYARCMETWVTNTPSFNGKTPIRPDPDWDYSRLPPDENWYRNNIYTADRAQTDKAWHMLQLAGDTLRPGWPTKRRLAHIIDSLRLVRKMPKAHIRTPLSLVLADDDRVVCNEAAAAICGRIADLRDIVHLPGVRHAVDLAPSWALEKVAVALTRVDAKRFPWRTTLHQLTPGQAA